MNEDVSRRGALGLGLVVAGAAVTSCVRPAAAQAIPPSVPPTASPLGAGAGKPPSHLLAAPPAHQLVALPFDATRLSGLSEKLLTLHHDKNYAGAVNKLNAIRSKLQSADPAQSGSYWSEYGTLKAGESAARNSALLHELYFGNLRGPAIAPPKALAAALAARFGGLDAAIRRVKACGKSTGGWVVLAFDPESNTIEIVPTGGHRGGAWSAVPLLVLDVFEHAYALDYGPNKGAYLDAFFANVDWAVVGKRFDHAMARRG